MLLHEGNEVSLGEQLWWAGLPIHHFHSAGLEAGALLIDREELERAAGAEIRSHILSLILLHQPTWVWSLTVLPLPGAHLLITLSLQ